MDHVLSSPVRLLGPLLLWGKVEGGELTLSDGRLTLTTSGETRFSVPVDEARFRFPMIYFGLGVKLRVRGESYRAWFSESLHSARGEGNLSDGPVSSFSTSDIPGAREATRQWRAAVAVGEQGRR